MSIIYQIPHTARFFSPRVEFTAAFNVPLIGSYSFDVAANQNKTLLEVKENSIYLIERINWSASVGSEVWTGSLDPLTIPEIVIKGKIDEALIFPKPFSLANYASDAPFVAWYICNRSNDALQISAAGAIKQIAATIGVPEISIVLSFSIYAVEGVTDFNTAFRGVTSPNAGQQVIGGI